MATTEQSFVDHILVGHDGPCLVCSGPRSYRAWTDVNGQCYCLACGCTYQILGCHFRQEFLDKHGIMKERVAREYCDCFEGLEVFRAYWSEVGKMMPLGSFIGRSPYLGDQRQSWGRWLAENRERFRDNEYFNWDSIIAWHEKQRPHDGPQPNESA